MLRYLSVSYSKSPDPSNSFLITNDGNLPIQDVVISCGSAHPTLGNPNYPYFVTTPLSLIQEIASGESAHVSCIEKWVAMEPPIEKDRKYVIVDFHILGIHWPQKIVKFTMNTDKQGNIYWVKEPFKQ